MRYCPVLPRGHRRVRVPRRAPARNPQYRKIANEHYQPKSDPQTMCQPFCVQPKWTTTSHPSQSCYQPNGFSSSSMECYQKSRCIYYLRIANILALEQGHGLGAELTKHLREVHLAPSFNINRRTKMMTLSPLPVLKSSWSSMTAPHRLPLSLTMELRRSI